MKEIKIWAGTHIDIAYSELQNEFAKSGEVCFCEFNGKKIYSNESIDEVYQKLFGESLFERKEQERKELEEYERELQEHKDAIPSLTEQYREKARGVIAEKYLELWDKIVPARLEDLYRGMELDCWLELIAVLNDESKSKDERFAECKRLHIAQDHSGISHSLVLSGLKQLHDLGAECANYINAD